MRPTPAVYRPPLPQPTSVQEVVKRLVRIESKLHALAKGLQIDLNAQLDQESWEERGNRP